MGHPVYGTYVVASFNLDLKCTVWTWWPDNWGEDNWGGDNWGEDNWGKDSWTALTEARTTEAADNWTGQTEPIIEHFFSKLTRKS